MKKMIFALCLVGCLVGCKSKNDSTSSTKKTRTKININTEIKTVPQGEKTSIKYEGKGYQKSAISYKLTDGGLMEYENTYEVLDDNGKKVYEAYVSYENGVESLSESYTYTYDENGNLLVREDFYRLKLSTTSCDYNYKNEYTYNGSLAVKANRYSIKGSSFDLVGTVDYEYDSNNNLITETNNTYSSLYDDGVSTTKYVYKYDSNNMKISYKKFDEDDDGNLRSVPTLEYTYEYDANKNLTKERVSSTYFYINVTMTSETQYTYEGNKLVEEIYYSIVKNGEKPTPSTKKIYTYDEKGNKSSVLSYYYDSSKSKFVESQKSEYSYNDKGEETLETLYSFDDGNWVLARKTETSYKMIG